MHIVLSLVILIRLSTHWRGALGVNGEQLHNKCAAFQHPNKPTNHSSIPSIRRPRVNISQLKPNLKLHTSKLKIPSSSTPQEPPKLYQNDYHHRSNPQLVPPHQGELQPHNLNLAILPLRKPVPPSPPPKSPPSPIPN